MCSGLRSFRFFNAWVNHSYFKNLIKDELVRSREASRNFSCRLRSIKGVIRRWQSEQFSINVKQIRECEEALHRLLSSQVPSDPREWLSSKRTNLI